MREGGREGRKEGEFELTVCFVRRDHVSYMSQKLTRVYYKFLSYQDYTLTNISVSPPL